MRLIIPNTTTHSTNMVSRRPYNRGVISLPNVKSFIRAMIMRDGVFSTHLNPVKESSYAQQHTTVYQRGIPCKKCTYNNSKYIQRKAMPPNKLQRLLCLTPNGLYRIHQKSPNFYAQDSTNYVHSIHKIMRIRAKKRDDLLPKNTFHSGEKNHAF